MKIKYIFRRNIILFIFILNSIVIVYLTNNINGFVDTKSVLKPSEELSYYTDNFYQNNMMSSFLEKYYNVISKVGETRDIDSSFEAIYDLLNPKSVIEANLEGKNVTIAILDSGINVNPWINPERLIGTYTTVPNSTIVTDSDGHGTLVSSIIAKIAPEANLISIKVTDDRGLAKPEWVQEGLELALENNATIIQASLGSTDLEAMNRSIINEMMKQNISIVISAGNEGPYGSSLTTPAIFDEVISVGMAFNETLIPIFSSIGPRPTGLLGPDLIAPGINIPGYINGETIDMRSGTSFAAPFVTGTVALLRGAFTSLTPMAIKATLLETANFIDNISPIQQGNGFLDISRAYQRLKTITDEPIFAFAPKMISSKFLYYGHSINGENRTYKIGLYTTINSTLREINTTLINPIQINIENLPISITTGLNYLNLSLFIPETLPMDQREANITFSFFNGMNWFENFSIFVENRYPGGNILFYQGYDNDSFIPDGPVGSFSQLHYLLEQFYGMNTIGAIKPSGLIKIGGPLTSTYKITGELTQQDLVGKDILVLADIEYGISESEIDLIHDWVSEGHSLLVLSYPSLEFNGLETLSNQTTINMLLNPYGISIEDDVSKPQFKRFNNATISISEPIFSHSTEEIIFTYNGTSVSTVPTLGAKILATARDINNGEEDIPIAAYWEDKESLGKVVVFGSELPFNDLGITFSIDYQNLLVVSQIFRWMIQDQQVPLELIFTSTPTLDASTKIQITIEDPAFKASYFNGTIIEANGSFSQITFKKSVNTYVGSWKPLATGQAILWFNIDTPTKANTNGVFIIEVYGNLSSDLFLLLAFIGFILLAASFYFLSSRRTPTTSPIEERMALELRKRKTPPKHGGLETLEICPRCQTPKYAKESRYCFKCGKDL